MRPFLGLARIVGLAAASFIGLAALSSLAFGQGGDPAAVYIKAGARLRYRVATAPVPARELGRVALQSLDRARGVSRADAVPILGTADPAVPGAGWPKRLGMSDSGGSTMSGEGPAPLGARDARGACRKCGTIVGDVRSARVAALYAEIGFDVGAEGAKLRLLELRAHYRDGLVAYINGREVARRNRPAARGPMSLARRPHGPEWETFYITVTPGLLVRGPNWLTIEVRPSGRRLAPLLDLELRGGTRARLVRGPLVQRVGNDRATIVFDTDLPTHGVVEYGADASLGTRVVSASGALGVHHVVELKNLPASAAVFYRVIGGGDASHVMSFHTAPANNEPLRFAVYGDTRGGHRVHQQIVRSVLRDAPDLVLVTGDLVYRGTDEGDWQRFFSVAGDLLARVPFYPAAGNHDMGKSGDEERRLSEIFALPKAPAARPSWGSWYSFDVSGVHFVMLDSNSYEHSAQLEWLELDLSLARHRGVRAIFAVVHAGPYSRGVHRGHPVAAALYAPVLAAAKVSMLFSGHDHIYQRGQVKGLRYIVSGGGGAPLYRITCGARGKPRCKVRDGAKRTERAFHYVLVTVGRRRVRVCAKRPDGTPLEKCVSFRLPALRRKRR